jgi:hypothetical protein
MNQSVGIGRKGWCNPSCFAAGSVWATAIEDGRLTRRCLSCGPGYKLTIMKLANRKNMMSINGMISIRAVFCVEVGMRLSFEFAQLHLGAFHCVRYGDVDFSIDTRFAAPAAEVEDDV